MHEDSAEHLRTGIKDAPGTAGLRSCVEQAVPSHGALELFIQQFNLYESRADLFARCRDEEGFGWWDVARYNVQYALCAEKGIYATPKAAKSPLTRRAYSFASQTRLFAKDAIKIAFLDGKDIEQSYVFGRRCGHLLSEIDKSIRPCLVVSDNGESRGPHIAINKRSVDFFVRIVSRWIRTPDALVAECARLSAEIRAEFGSKLDVKQIILSKYRQHRAAFIAWSLILSKLNTLKLVGFVGDDTLKTLVYLANAKKIKTREFQHGYMGKSHVNYSYPALSVSVETLPQEVMVDRDSGDIVYPATLIRSAGAGLTAAPLDAGVAKDIDVLVGGSPTRATEAISIVRALVGKGLVLAVKLHPKQSEISSGIRKHFTADQVQIYSSEMDFNSIVRRAKVYVPANPTSTTVFEAVDNGVSLIVVDYEGIKMTSMLDAIVSERVGSFQDLHRAVLNQLDQRRANTPLLNAAS